jgi:hypothetical protein
MCVESGKWLPGLDWGNSLNDLKVQDILFDRLNEANK